MRVALKLAIILVVVAVQIIVAFADTRLEWSADLRPGDRFVLDTDAGKVSVVGTPGSQVKIVANSPREDLESVMTFELLETAEGVELKAQKIKKNKSWWKSWRGVKLEYRIEVPYDTDLHIDTAGGSIEVEQIHNRAHLDTSGGAIRAHDVRGELHADTSGGSIKVSDIGGPAHLDTSGGSIKAHRVAGSVVADTSGGSIELVDIDGSVEADTSGGWIKVISATGFVEADTSGGGIEVVFAAGNEAGGLLSSSGGGIEVSLDPAANLSVNASSSGGYVTSDVPLTSKIRASKTQIQGVIGAGGNPLTISTSGGPIHIQPL